MVVVRLNNQPYLLLALHSFKLAILFAMRENRAHAWPGCEHIDLNARVSLLPDAMRDIRGHIRSMLLSLRMKCDSLAERALACNPL